MYWTDAKSQRIEMADMDGSNVQIIMRHNDTLDYANGTKVFGAGGAHYFGVAVDQTHIYFSDWKRKYVHLFILLLCSFVYGYSPLYLLDGISFFVKSCSEVNELFDLFQGRSFVHYVCRPMTNTCAFFAFGDRLKSRIHCMLFILPLSYILSINIINLSLF